IVRCSSCGPVNDPAKEKTGMAPLALPAKAASSVCGDFFRDLFLRKGWNARVGSSASGDCLKQFRRTFLVLRVAFFQGVLRLDNHANFLALLEGKSAQNKLPCVFDRKMRLKRIHVSIITTGWH
ncbi:MAG: hypothetical protein ACREBW_00895, partial [Candidatus Micrarchaeaceae archaeon]